MEKGKVENHPLAKASNMHRSLNQQGQVVRVGFEVCLQRPFSGENIRSCHQTKLQ